jgi:hypothetical protein
MTFAKPFCVKPDVCPPAPVNQPNNCNPANREGALPPGEGALPPERHAD